jgi:hypothetical protein
MAWRTFVARAGLAATLGALIVACGQKGPPLAPLRLVPAAVTDVSLRRVGDHARLRFVLPTTNANGPGPVQLDRVEIYAVTVAPGAPTPPNRELLTRDYLVGHVAVRRMPIEGESPEIEDDPRPAPGEVVTFEEDLTEEKRTPVPFKPAEVEVPPTVSQPATAAQATPTGLDPAARLAVEKPAAPAAPAGDAVGVTGAKPGDASTPPGTTVPAPSPIAATTPPVRTEPVRIYLARGVTRGGRPGPPSTRVELPIVDVPPPPTGLDATVTEEAVILEWAPPDTAPDVVFNVYEGTDDLQPVTPKPIASPTFEQPVRFGEERCYRVRSARVAGAVVVEGPPSEPFCLTPEDIFPPAAPTGLAAVSTAGQVSLIWDANTEADLAGYLVLRGETPEGSLQPLTPSPIRETSFRDTTVVPGVQYMYVVVAVDTATPPNMSAMSERVAETAR